MPAHISKGRHRESAVPENYRKQKNCMGICLGKFDLSC